MLHLDSSLTRVWKKASANLAGLLALPCGMGEFSCVPPHNEEEKHKVHTNYQQLVLNFCHLFLANGHTCIYVCIIWPPHPKCVGPRVVTSKKWPTAIHGNCGFFSSPSDIVWRHLGVREHGKGEGRSTWYFNRFQSVSWNIKIFKMIQKWNPNRDERYMIYLYIRVYH